MPIIGVRIPRIEDWKAQVKCQAGCPVATDAGRDVHLIAEGRDQDAYLVARAPNPLASVCGRVCAAPCEDPCRRGSIDAPISIRALKRFVTEHYGVESTRPDTQDQLRTPRVVAWDGWRQFLL
jgi:NADPH-dependent glutamate synthase beta subunit-like oxidoreductase